MFWWHVFISRTRSITWALDLQPRERLSEIHINGRFFPCMFPPFFGIPGHAAFLLLPLCIIEIGGSPSAAAAVIGFKGLGMMLCDIPGGKIASKIGNKLTMQVAAMVVGFAFLAYSFCDSVILFWLVAFIHGCGSSTFLVGRMSFFGF